MKKLLGILVLGLLWCNLSFAEIRKIEGEYVPTRGSYDGVAVSTICVDGYKFVVVRGRASPSVTQAFEEKDGKSLPAKC